MALGSLQKPLAQGVVENAVRAIRTFATASRHTRLGLQITHSGRARFNRCTQRFFIDTVTNTNDHDE
jgi:hypothetical protein